MIKRIGIISLYYKNQNCGGQLQAYALVQFLKKVHIDSTIEQIRYAYAASASKPHKKRFFRLIYKYTLIEAIRIICRRIYMKRVQNLTDIYCPTIALDRQKGYNYFEDKLIDHSEELYTNQNITDIIGRYDCFIVGSDQVWRNVTDSSVYLLNFVKDDSKKIAYAASVSEDKLSNYSQKAFQNSLKHFKAVSVREKEAVGLLQPLCPTKIEWVLDPTMLLSAEDWNEVCEERIVPEEYVFCYFLGADKKERKLATEFAGRKGLKLVTFIHLANHYVAADVHFGDVQIYDVSPEKFLSLVKYAKYVFTDSFHATVFSHIYQKEFFAFSRQGHKEMGSRLYSLTDILENRDHFCDTKDKANIQYIMNLSAIDYTKKLPKFEQMKEKSINFLKENLKD